MCGLPNRHKNEETHTYKSIGHGGIVLMCRVTNRDEKTKPYTYKSIRNGRVIFSNTK